MNVFNLQRVDGATLNTVMMVGLKVIFVITSIIGLLSALSEIRSRSGPLQPRPCYHDFFSPNEAFLPAECNTIGITSVYTEPGAPRIHKELLLT